MLEVNMDDCFKRGDSSSLASLLRDEGLTSTTLTRLHQLVTEQLSGSTFSGVMVALKSLEILSDSRDDLQTLVDLGLPAKVLMWFQTVCDLLTSETLKSSSHLLSLTEGFYDYFLLLSQSSSLPVGQLSLILLDLSRSALKPEIHFTLRLEAIRTFNSILESLSREQRKLIQMDQNHVTILSQVAAAIQTVGDYELQVSLSEALCRLTPRKERLCRASHWFSSRDISKAFCDIRDGDFEVDCRRFLNFVNSCQGNQRRVHTFPCIRAYLDTTELFRPNDDKLDEFWIDFNFGSRCVSFFIDEPQGSLWGSVHLLREDVDHYDLQLEQEECSGSHMVLSVQLNNPIMHLNTRGQMVKIVFTPEQQRDLEDAAGRVFLQSIQREQGCLSPAPPASAETDGRFYNRKKPPTQLKILPLSSPSSDEDSSVTKTRQRRRAEFLFDQIQHSTPSYDSGVLVGAELEETLAFGNSSSASKKEDFRCDRKRPAGNSGYLSDTTQDLATQRQKVEPLSEGEESYSVLSGHPTEGVASPLKEGVGLPIKTLKEMRVESKVNMTSDIKDAFKTFKETLEQHFNKMEADVFKSLKDCQQQVSSLLMAVHQHRLVLLQNFEKSIADQLSHLEENSTILSNMSTQILEVFQSEMQRLGSFCDKH